MLFLKLRLFRWSDLAKESLRVGLGGTALFLGRLMPNEHRLRLDNAQLRMPTECERHRRAESNAGGECGDLKNSIFHNMKISQCSGSFKRCLVRKQSQSMRPASGQRK